MLKKIPLHWQILIALVLAIGYGIMFPDRYTIDEGFFARLEKQAYDESIDAQYIFGDELGKTLSQQEFLLRLQTHFNGSDLKSKQKSFLDAARTNDAIDAISWMGVLFMRALKMLIIPLILSSIVSGVAGIGTASGLGRLTLKTMGYYLISSLVAIITGLLLVNLLKPGLGMGLVASASDASFAGTSTFKDTLLNIIPENIFSAMAAGDMLSIIFFAILMGFFITRLTDVYREKMISIFSGFFELMMKITLFVIRFTPLGVFALVAGVVAPHSDLMALAGNMGVYMLAVIGALAFHGIVTLPLAMRFMAKVSPIKQLRAMRVALLTAFSTSSSGATLPLTMEAVEQRSGVSNKISSFTLPMGATINMDGTALYECVAVIFIANAYGIDLSFGQQVIVVITSLLASIGAAAVPMAGLVMMTIILTAVGLPLEGVGLILAVDRILDMFRTVINVWSDSTGAVIVASSEGEHLKVSL
jgi:proton glutamate symport protein